MYERAVALEGGNRMTSVGLGYALARAGRHEEVRRILDRLVADAEKQYVSPHAIAALLLGLGEHDQAIDWLERAYRERDRALVWIKVHPRLDPVRGNPRFEGIRRLVMGEP